MEQRAGYAEVNGTRLYYEEAGAGDPLVFVHGFSLDRRMWDDQWDAFAGEYHVVRYDARGFGKSAVPTEAPYFIAGDLKALLEHLRIERAFLVGLSMGGGIVTDFAIRYPEAARAAVLIDAAVGGHAWSPEFLEMIGESGRRARTAGLAAGKELWLESPLFAPLSERPEPFARLRQMVADWSGWQWLNRDPGQGLDPPAVQQLDRLTVPTLALVGERDLPDFHRIAARVQAEAKDARAVVVASAGHMANMEEPARVNEEIRQFLDEVRGRGR